MLSHGERIRATTQGETGPRLRYGPRRWWFSTCRPLFRATSFCGLRERGLMARKNRNHRRHEYVISFPARPFRLPYDVIVWAMYPCHHDQDARYYRILICKPSCSQHFFFFFFFSSRKFRKGRNFDEELRKHVSQFPRFKTKSWISNTPFTRQAFVLRVHQDSW